MQISDMLNQYNRNTATGATAASPQQGVQQLVSAVRTMTVGNVFEGTVNEMRHGQVLLGLSNGQTVIARVAANIHLAVGQSMFFQVKSNDGTTVEIKPYMNGNLDNPTILKALDAAGIPADAAAVEMVNSMMEENLAIDRKSLQEMARAISGFKGADIRTLVQMSKLDIPLTEEMIAQFGNYKNDRSAITGQFQEVLDSLTQIYQNEGLSEQDALAMGNRIFAILEPSSAEIMAEASKQLVRPDGEWSPVTPIEVGADGMQEALQAESPAADTVLTQTDDGVHYYPPNTLGAVLSEEALKELAQQLSEFPKLAENAKLFADGILNRSLTSTDFLQELHQTLAQTELPAEASAKELFAGRGYRDLLKNAMEQEWLLRPQEVKADKIKDLYQKLNHQMEQMEQIMHETEQNHTPLAKAVSQLQGNIEFMNQISQAYHYVQLPLKMSVQNAKGDLYVYSNKKNLHDPEGDLTAFLHLDMEHLGSTDVSVRMRAQKVHTDFFMGDDRSFALIQEHVEALITRLNEKGYQCTIEVKNQEQKVDFVEDFMKKDQPGTGILHRYSFDVRA